jgi:hypothetical protein
MAFAAPLSPLTAGVFARQRELEEALAARESDCDERGRLLARAKAAIETLHAELLRTRRDAEAYRTEVRRAGRAHRRAPRAR